MLTIIPITPAIENVDISIPNLFLIDLTLRIQLFVNIIKNKLKFKSFISFECEMELNTVV